jgi:protein tyrosine/serine phosphatase
LFIAHSPAGAGHGPVKWDNRDMVWINLEGAVNVRDLGGLPTSDGGTIAAGQLLRSENLQELTGNDIARLVEEIGVTTVVDLRSSGEIATEGPAPLDALPGVRHAHHPVLREYLHVDSEAAVALLTKAIEADRARYPDDHLAGHYLGYLENRPDQVAGAMRAITTAPGAAIVHCAAGKDRTGVVVALALSVAGVGADDIVADYMATNERLDALVERLRRSRTYAADMAGRPVSVHAPRAESMRAFLAQLEARHGGAAAWLAAAGFGTGELDQLRAKLRQA